MRARRHPCVFWRWPIVCRGPTPICALTSSAQTDADRDPMNRLTAHRLARFALVLTAVVTPALRAQGFGDKVAGFDQIGSFRGAPIDDFGDAFENEVFREARSGDLFQ